MGRLRAEVEAFARQGAVDRIQIAMVQSELHPVVLWELKRIFGAKTARAALEQSVLLVATDRVKRHHSILDQINFDRTSQVLRAFADEMHQQGTRPPGKKLLTISVLRWQIVVLASNWNTPSPSATAFGNFVLRECSELLLPLLGPVEDDHAHR